MVEVLESVDLLQKMLLLLRPVKTNGIKEFHDDLLGGRFCGLSKIEAIRCVSDKACH